MFYPQELLKIKVLPIKKWVLIFLSFVTIEKLLYFFLFFCLTKNRMKMAIKRPTMDNMIHVLFIPRFVTSLLLFTRSFDRLSASCTCFANGSSASMALFSSKSKKVV